MMRFWAVLLAALLTVHSAVAETLTLQPDATDGVDNLLLGAAPTSNQGTNVALGSRASSNQRSIIKFDLSEVPEGSVCTEATLTLTTRVGSNAGEHNVNAIKAANGAWTEAGSNWNTIEGSTAWAGSAGASTSGTDFNASNMGTFTAGANDGDANNVTLDCDQVEAWFDNVANYGLVLWNTSGGGDQFYSSDHSTAEQRPKLVVEYTAAEEEVTVDDDQEWGHHWANGRWQGRFQ